jgi:hypothetical protein
LIALNKQHVVDSCTVVGFVGIGNAQQDITPTQLNNNNAYYTPVKYPGLLTEHAISQDACSSMINSFTIIFGVVVFVVQLIQVNTLPLYNFLTMILMKHIFY